MEMIPETSWADADTCVRGKKKLDKKKGARKPRIWLNIGDKKVQATYNAQAWNWYQPVMISPFASRPIENSGMSRNSDGGS